MKDISLKKIIIIFLSVFFLMIIITSIYFYNKSSNENNPPNFKNDYDKQQYINNFAKTQGKDPNKEIDKNSGGYSGLFLENKQDLLKYMSLDGMISVNDRIIEDLKYIEKFNTDVKKNNIDKYYKENTDVINTLFGFKNVSDFKEFMDKIKFVENSSITKASIQEGSISKNENVVIFNLVLSSANKSQTFKISVIVTESNQKYNTLITWIN